MATDPQMKIHEEICESARETARQREKLISEVAPWASKPPEIRSGEWVECPRCSGAGRVMRYPYYSNIMPELAEKPCEECGGRGRFFVIPDDCFTITISEARRHSTEKAHLLRASNRSGEGTRKKE